jgi:hypothetical protein
MLESFTVRTVVSWCVGAVLAVITLAILGLPWRYIDNYELGYEFDSRNGKITVLERSGYVGRHVIFERIHTVDLRPRQVCINANQRVLNCKLVRFNPDGLQLFVNWHGRADYNENLNDILLSYAYDGSGRTYPFLTVMRELRHEDTSAGLSQ